MLILTDQKREMAQVVAEKLSSPWWRIRNLSWIKPKSGPLTLFSPTKEQRRLYFDLWYRNEILKARQLGFSTLLALLIGDKCMWNEGFSAAICDKTLDDAKRKLAMIKRQWDNLDNPKGPFANVGKLIKSRLKLYASKTQLQWSNGSSVFCGTSVRGGTLQALHISELGYIAAHFPKRAEEIMSGGVPALSKDCLIFSESTHEGGPYGVHANLIKTSMALIGKDLSELDFKFHWFPWFGAEDYRSKVGEIEPDLREYFDETLPMLGINIDDDQKRFYSSQYRVLKHRIKTEYPSTPKEAMEAANAGAIYAHIVSMLRIKGRVKDFAVDQRAPILAFWDIGVSDSTAIWFMQFVGKEINVIGWIEDSGQGVGYYAKQIAYFEREHGPVLWHYLPHDAEIREKGSAMTYRQQLEQTGIRNIVVVPRTPDKWVGINEVRTLLPRCWFLPVCDKSRLHDGIEYPSGLACLEMYRREYDISAGKLTEEPVHDFSSHSCDAFRTMGEAWARGLIHEKISYKPEKKAAAKPPLMGFRNDGDSRKSDDDFSDFEP